MRKIQFLHVDCVFRNLKPTIESNRIDSNRQRFVENKIYFYGYQIAGIWRIELYLEVHTCNNIALVAAWVQQCSNIKFIVDSPYLNIQSNKIKIFVYKVSCFAEYYRKLNILAIFNVWYTRIIQTSRNFLGTVKER
jgi:hypothetical protein